MPDHGTMHDECRIRIENLEKEAAAIVGLSKDFAVLNVNVKHIKEAVDEVRKMLEANYVAKADFIPVQRIVYGMVGAVLLGVLGVILKVVFNGQ